MLSSNSDTKDADFGDAKSDDDDRDLLQDQQSREIAQEQPVAAPESSLRQDPQSREIPTAETATHDTPQAGERSGTANLHVVVGCHPLVLSAPHTWCAPIVRHGAGLESQRGVVVRRADGSRIA